MDFYAYDPARDAMRRKKYMLNGIERKSDRRKRAAEMAEALLKLLRGGWSPWVNVEENRGYTLLSDALDKYERALEKMPKERSRETYRCYFSMFRSYLGRRVIAPRYVYQLDAALYSDFLDWLYLDREVSARTRNNYRGWLSSFSAFMVERDYLPANPAAKIRNIPEEAKKRQPLTAAMLAELKRYLAEKSPMMLLACMMEYYTMIRPAELACIRLRDISLREQSVFIAAEFSKNKRDGKVGLNDEVARMLVDLRVFDNPGDWFLFGEKLRVSPVRASDQLFSREWIKVRKALKWPDKYKFYSLKDSGIRDLANASGIVIARDQARHTDVATTNHYLQGRDLPVHDEAKHFKGAL